MKIHSLSFMVATGTLGDMQPHIWILRGLALTTIGCALAETRFQTADTGPATDDSLVDAGSNDDAPRRCRAGFELDRSDSCVAWHAPDDWPGFGEHTATRLLDGRVFAVGRPWNESDAPGAIFDPNRNHWTPLAGAPAPLAGRTATLLADGRVLLVGGSAEEDQGRDHVVATTILFDPQSLAFTSIATPSVARAYHSAAMLPDGRVLIAGGYATSVRALATSSSEVFDAEHGTWSTATPMGFARARHTATARRDQVVVVGGTGFFGENSPRQTTEIYSASEDTWRRGESPSLRLGSDGGYMHTTNALDDGALLIVGSAGAERFYPRLTLYSVEAWIDAGTMFEPRSQHVATRLLDGRVLVASGGPWSEHSAEIYDPTSNVWHATIQPPPGIWGGTATLLLDGRVLLVCSRGALLFEIASRL